MEGYYLSNSSGYYFLILPGIGQVVQGETQKGIIMFVIALVLAVLTSMVSPMVSFISLIFIYLCI